jgi:hypothetical protein
MVEKDSAYTKRVGFVEESFYKPSSTLDLTNDVGKLKNIEGIS